MQNTSELYRNLASQSGRTFKAKILVTFPDSSTAELTDENIMQGSLVIKQGTSEEGSFTVGSAVIGELDFEIDNSSGTYDNTSFDGAVFDVRIGLVTQQKYDGTFTVEWLRKGVYTAEEVTVNGKYITVVAFDNTAKLDVPFADVSVNFPRTLATLYTAICTHCGIPYAFPDFANAAYIVSTGEYIDADATCREIMSYIAQMARTFVICDSVGTLHLKWYEEAIIGYDVAHNKIFYELNERQKINSTVQITGISFIDQNGDEALVGTSGYCLRIEDNPLALTDDYLDNDVWTNRRVNGLVGMKLTPFSSEVISDPAIEAGDIIKITDVNGTAYLTPITNIVFRLDAKMSVSCDAETVNENRRSDVSTSARILVRSKKNTAKQISQYDIRAKQFSQIAVNAMGFYQTDEVQNDGSTITYLHDKPLLADSMTVWKKSVDGFFVSDDGGQTYIAGMDSSGNAVLNILAVKGIVADWIKAGTISDALGNFALNMSNGNIVMQLGSGKKLKIYTTGITMYDANDSVLASMFVSTQGHGVLTGNVLRVGTRSSERTIINTDNNGKGCISTDFISTGSISCSDPNMHIYKDGNNKGNIDTDYLNAGVITGAGNKVDIYEDSDGKGHIDCDKISIGNIDLHFITVKNTNGIDCHVLGY